MRQLISAKEDQILGMTMFLNGQTNDPPDSYLKLNTLSNVIEKFEKLTCEAVPKRFLDVRNAIAHGAVRPAPGTKGTLYPLELLNTKLGKVIFREVMDEKWFKDLSSLIVIWIEKVKILTKSEAPGFWAYT